MHSYGYAVDINPLRNPTKDKSGKWWPAGSDTFAGRDKVEKGKIVLHSDAFETFARYG
jgi:hypothetical protein